MPGTLPAILGVLHMLQQILMGVLHMLQQILMGVLHMLHQFLMEVLHMLQQFLMEVLHMLQQLKSKGRPGGRPLCLDGIFSELKKRAQRKMQSIGDVRHRCHGWIIFAIFNVAQTCDMNSACVTQLPQAHTLEVAMMAYQDANEIHVIFLSHDLVSNRDFKICRQIYL